MNDIENEMFTKIATTLREKFSGIFVTGEYLRNPPKFPHVSIEEADSYTEEGDLDTSESEKFRRVMYEANVYSNKTSGKKSEAKAIMDVVDKIMHSMNFIRTSRTPVPNLENATIYRITARYEAVTDGNLIYRR